MLGCPFPSIYGPARSVAHYSRHWGEIKALKYMEFVRAKCGFSRTVCSLIWNRTSKETSNRNAASMGSLGSVSTFFFLETVCFRTASTNELARLLLSRDNSGQAHKKAMIHFRRIGQIISWVGHVKLDESNLIAGGHVWIRLALQCFVWCPTCFAIWSSCWIRREGITNCSRTGSYRFTGVFCTGKVARVEEDAT